MSESGVVGPTPTVGELLCFDLYSTSRVVIAFYRPMLDRTGLTYPQFLVLTLLWERDNQPMGALAQRLDLEYNTVSPLVKRMEKAGLLERVTNPDDERSVLVRLTEDGEKLGSVRGHSQRSAASAMSSRVLLNAMAALGACCRTRLTTFSNSSRYGSCLRIPPPTTTHA